MFIPTQKASESGNRGTWQTGSLEREHQQSTQGHRLGDGAKSPESANPGCLGFSVTSPPPPPPPQSSFQPTKALSIFPFAWMRERVTLCTGELRSTGNRRTLQNERSCKEEPDPDSPHGSHSDSREALHCTVSQPHHGGFIFYPPPSFLASGSSAPLTPLGPLGALGLCPAPGPHLSASPCAGCTKGLPHSTHVTPIAGQHP